MSCFTSCFTRPQLYHQLINRNTSAPVKFDRNQIDELRKKFSKIAGFKQDIEPEAFKKNMGILGLHCALEFSGRMFNAFDLDNDGKISFQDFIEYMQILKSGTEKQKAKISFKLIAAKNSNSISQQNFKQFLKDFFNSWASITNIGITNEIKDRTDQYLSLLFKKVKKETGKDLIDAKYYIEKLYKDKDYMQSFQFITEGMASMFVHDQSEQDKNPEFMLYKVLNQINQIIDTVFEMNNEDSYQYQIVHVQSIPKELPSFVPKFPSKVSRNNLYSSLSTHNLHDFRNNKNNEEKSKPMEQTKKVKLFANNEPSETYENSHSSTYNKSHRRQKQLNLDSQSQIFALMKKMGFIKEKLNQILAETSNIYGYLKQKFENKQQEVNKHTKEAVKKNVHKRLDKDKGKMIFIGDDNWNLVLNMMIGIQMAVRSVKGFQEMIYEEPKDFDLKYYFELIPRRFGNEEYNSTIYSFTDYAPHTFNHIRKIFKIDNQEYIGSIGPNKLMASLMMGQVSSMTSLTSQGKSGSFFYYTADGKYMLKTIKYREYRFLRQILQDYYYYIKKNPDTLITKFFGLHKLIEKNQKGSETCRWYFVIMANVFNTKEKIIERYDIKGSWQGRTTSDKDPSATKKDNDFKERSPIYLMPQERNNILNIIKRDSEFFQKHQIIDYSLLIGVIRKSESDVSDVRNTQSIIFKEDDRETYANRQSKIFQSLESNETYIFGIIDILTLYDSKKVFEYYFKRIFIGDGTSAVPPSDYAQRFTTFIQDKVFPEVKVRRSHLEQSPSRIKL